MISPISFSGIKNVGYARVIKNNSNGIHSCVSMNMELTDDKDGEDLTFYRNLVKVRPSLRNEINDRFINIEFNSIKVPNDYSRPGAENTVKWAMFARLNGQSVSFKPENKELINYMTSLAQRVANFKERDYKIDPAHHLMREAKEGLVYKECIDDYMDGSSGRLELLEGTGLIEQFDYYLNSEPLTEDFAEELSQEDEMINDAMDGVVAVLHEPAYVHNGAVIMESLLRGYAEYFKKDVDININ